MRRLLLILGVALVSSGLTAAALTYQAQADDDRSSAATRASAERPKPFGLRHHDPEQLAERRDAFLADVAGRLDVTVEELREALKGAALAQVDRLVAEGEISEQRAERLKQRIEMGARLLLGPGPGLR